VAPYWDQGRKVRRASDRLRIDTQGNPRRVATLKSLPQDHPDYPHGDTGYQYGCRCDTCLTVHNLRMAEYRRRAGITQPGRYIPKSQRKAVCGTRGGYNRHRRLGEEPCAACRKANSQYQSAYAKGVRMIDPAIDAAIRHGM